MRVILCQQLRWAFSIIARSVWHATCMDYDFDEVEHAQRGGIVQWRAAILAFSCIWIRSRIEQTLRCCLIASTSRIVQRCLTKLIYSVRCDPCLNQNGDTFLNLLGVGRVW